MLASCPALPCAGHEAAHSLLMSKHSIGWKCIGHRRENILNVVLESVTRIIEECGISLCKLLDAPLYYSMRFPELLALRVCRKSR